MLTRGERKNSFKNLIYFFGLAALCLAFAAIGVQRMTMTSVALEQETVCGKEEHVHGKECYDEYGILRCEKAEHVHNSDCYLVLLADNDINVLLVDIEENEDHSLEGVVEETISRAAETLDLASADEDDGGDEADEDETEDDSGETEDDSGGETEDDPEEESENEEESVDEEIEIDIETDFDEPSAPLPTEQPDEDEEEETAVELDIETDFDEPSAPLPIEAPTETDASEETANAETDAPTESASAETAAAVELDIETDFDEPSAPLPTAAPTETAEPTTDSGTSLVLNIPSTDTPTESAIAETAAAETDAPTEEPVELDIETDFDEPSAPLPTEAPSETATAETDIPETDIPETDTPGTGIPETTVPTEAATAEVTEEADDGSTEITLDKETIEAINEATANSDSSSLILNVDANVSESVTVSSGGSSDVSAASLETEATDEPEATASPEPTDEALIETLDIGDSVTSGAANIYVYLDGEWTLIGSVAYSTTQAGPRTTYTVDTSGIADLINDIFGTSYTYWTDFRVRYATNVNANNYTSPQRQNSTITAQSSDTTYYIRIYDSSNSGYLYFYSVTYNYADGTTDDIYVPSGTTITLPSDASEWTNDDTGTAYSGGASYTVTSKTSFTEAGYTVTYVYLDGTTATVDVDVGDTIILVESGYGWTTDYTDYYEGEADYTVSGSVTFYEAACKVTYIYLDGTTDSVYIQMNGTVPLWYTEYSWNDGTTDYDAYDDYTVTADVTFTETAYTVTYEYIDGTTETMYVKKGSDITLPSTYYGWTDGTTVYDGGESYTPTGDITFTENGYMITYLDAGGATLEIAYVKAGDSITLRETSYIWQDDAGNTYESGEIYTPTADMTFTEYDETITITYNLNYPSALSDYTADEDVLYIIENDGTTYTYTAHQSQTVTAASSSARVVYADISGFESLEMTYAVYFEGWQVTVDGTTYTIEPGEEIDWDTLLSYASDGEITFEGVWEYSYATTCNFFLRYDSVAVDYQGNISGGSSTYYTNNLYTTYVFNGTGNTSYTITDTSSDNSYTADQNIRALVNPSDTSPWLWDFPEDEYIFELLKEIVGDDNTVLSVDGVYVDPDELSSDYYAIRWYVFKKEGNTWHVDGKLVRKTGTIDVYKTFEGDDDAITTAKESFYIDAVSEEEGTEYTLTTSNYEDFDGDYDSSTDTYHWTIDGVMYLEQWDFTEVDYDITDYNCYTTYRVIDASGNESETGTGTAVTVYGMVYAVDSGADESLEVYFTNLYSSKDTLVIRKVDSSTGNSITGAEFSVARDGTSLSFVYDDETGIYYESSSGTEDTLTVPESGNVEVVFNKIESTLVVSEITVPDGYTTPTQVTLTEDDDGTLTLDEVNTGDADYDDSGGVLTIYNSPREMTLTVRKTWADAADAEDSVTMQLLANGRTVYAELPNLDGVDGTVTVTKNTSTGTWVYTWTGLPVYANGEPIDWSVREIAVGDESANSDYSFDNWIVYTYPAEYTMDSDGYTTHIDITVENTLRTVMLRVTKIDGDTDETLSDAEFTLQLVDGSYEIDSSFTALTLTTDANGTLTFTDIPYGTYLLTETSPPDGYAAISENIYVTISEDDDSVTVTGYGSYAYVDTANVYSIYVENFEAVELPGTGGSKTMYTSTGAIMILIAAIIYI